MNEKTNSVRTDAEINRMAMVSRLMRRAPVGGSTLGRRPRRGPGSSGITVPAWPDGPRLSGGAAAVLEFERGR